MSKHEQFLNELRSTMAVFSDCDGNISKAAKALGIPRNTMAHRIKAAERYGIYNEPEIKPPVLPEGDIPVPDIIDQLCNRFERRADLESAKKWMAFKVRSNDPIGIVWMGDPHIDDNGCNWPLLREHCDILSKTVGLYAVNIGDTHNNWVGRLMSKYADQDMSRDTAFKLIEWFFNHSGVKWLIMLLGNHDVWNDGARILRKIAENTCQMEDWRAQFKLVFPNGRECLIDAAHDFPGHSQWNPLHGLGKASVMGGRAHIYVAGHRHNWAMSEHECGETGRVYSLLRAKGYKDMDEYATRHGYANQKNGASLVSVIDPTAPDVAMVTNFTDVKLAAEYLTYLRGRNKCQKKKKNRN
jgi:hypothetical protein